MQKRIVLIFVLTLLCSGFADALTLERINYGNMNSWVKRNIKESAIIGGNHRTLYEIGPNLTINGDTPYVNKGNSPWATSNVMAKVTGVTKTSNAVFPEARQGDGMCAKLCTILEHVKAMGIINMDVLVSGSIFLGHVFEPIKSTSNPYSKMEMGVPYTKRPDFLVFDYKVYAPGGNRVYSSGFGSKKTIAGQDFAEVYILLQRRWEDAKGNLHAKRVGTGRERFGSSLSNWVNDHRIKVHYGNITNQPFYKSYMGLIDKNNAYYARNSKGKMVPVIEEGWADANETPTHVLVMASSGCGTAYTGTVGMTLWIDNIAFGFE
ncbi:MAG: PCMD domain-containing protein [Muribaculaceae bacterium]|nr:PCMD domain-containing protein [Muribaculaceae bacterium]